MLKLALTPGEFIEIGEGIRVVFSGRAGNSIHVLVDAPRSVNIARGKAMEKHGTFPVDSRPKRYKAEKSLSPEAKKKIAAIIGEERWRNGVGRPEDEEKTGRAGNESYR